MGDWTLRDGEWVHDPNLPTPVTAADYDPNATRVDLPVIDQPEGRVQYGGEVDYFDPSRAPATFTTEDGAVYERPDPDEFDCFDEVDSTTIVDDGGPPDG